MRWELKELQRRTGITFVHVTHAQSEAMALSDWIALVHQGVLLELSSPREPSVLREAGQLHGG